MSITNASLGSITMSTKIDAPVTRVWAALTDDIGAWWPAEFFAGGEEGARQFALEAWPGGRMLESWDGGGGVLWGTVVGIKPGAQLQITGDTFPNWGGPNKWYGTWDLKETKTGTALTFSESVLGRITEDGLKEKEKGWQFLWAVLKAHVEGTPAPTWTD